MGRPRKIKEVEEERVTIDSVLEDEIEDDDSDIEIDDIDEDEIEEAVIDPVKKGKKKEDKPNFYVTEDVLRREIGASQAQNKKATEDLGKIILLTVDRIATQYRYRGYTYLDDMKAEAIFQSVKGIMNFDLTKLGANGYLASSFSYLTQIINNAFKQVLKKEKKSQEATYNAMEEFMHEMGADTEFKSVNELKANANRSSQD